MGLFSGLFGKKKADTENTELDKLIKEIEENPEMAEKIHQLATLQRMENIHNLYKSGATMQPISTEEQQAYVMMIDFMKNNSLENGDEDMFKDFLHKVKKVHFTGNSVLGSYLRSV